MFEFGVVVTAGTITRSVMTTSNHHAERDDYNGDHHAERDDYLRLSSRFVDTSMVLRVTNQAVVITLGVMLLHANLTESPRRWTPRGESRADCKKEFIQVPAQLF